MKSLHYALTIENVKLTIPSQQRCCLPSNDDSLPSTSREEIPLFIPASNRDTDLNLQMRLPPQTPPHHHVQALPFPQTHKHLEGSPLRRASSRARLSLSLPCLPRATDSLQLLHGSCTQAQNHLPTMVPAQISIVLNKGSGDERGVLIISEICGLPQLLQTCYWLE